MKEIAANIQGLRGTPGPLDSGRAPASQGQVDGSIFRDQLAALQTNPASTAARQSSAPQLKFSNHAIDRMQARGIRYSPEEMAKITGAVQKAASKGAKESLLLTDTSALIVSIKDNTVVTVMDKASLKDNVFTNIDSTVVI